MKKSLDELLADISKEGKLKVICSYCKKILKPGPDDNISDGICEPCSTKMLWQSGFNEKDLTEFVNRHEEVAS